MLLGRAFRTEWIPDFRGYKAKDYKRDIVKPIYIYILGHLDSFRCSKKSVLFWVIGGGKITTVVLDNSILK
jgi:hypothetical protein